MNESALEELYDRDFFEWTQAAAAALRAARIPELDVAHVAEEIESMGKRDLRGAISRLERILEHKLELAFSRVQTLDRNARGWQNSVDKQQRQLRRILEDSPSLRARLPELFPKAYAAAAGSFTKNYEVSVPEECPWTLEEVLG